jgi:hypothetical protein
MLQRFNLFLDVMSDYLASRKGLLPALGIVLIIANGILQFVAAEGWLAGTNLLLHLGVILAILGFLLAWAL